MDHLMKKREKDRADFLECDECGEIFVIDEPFCPYCGKPREEVLKDMEKKQTNRKNRRDQQ